MPRFSKQTKPTAGGTVVPPSDFQSKRHHKPTDRAFQANFPRGQAHSGAHAHNKNTPTALLKYGHNRHSTLPCSTPTRSDPQPHFARISAQTLNFFVRAQLHLRHLAHDNFSTLGLRPRGPSLAPPALSPPAATPRRRASLGARLRHSNAQSKSGTTQITPFGCLLSELLRSYFSRQPKGYQHHFDRSQHNDLFADNSGSLRSPSYGC